jgi:hypothetical protein
MWHYGEKRGAYGVLWGNLRGKDDLEELGVYWKIIWFFKKWDGDWSGSG